MIYKGACFDILEALAKEVNFSFSVELESNVFGSENVTTGNWSGMVGSLLDNKTDMAVQLITENSARKEVSDARCLCNKLTMSRCHMICTRPRNLQGNYIFISFPKVVDFLPPFFTGHMYAYMKAQQSFTLFQFLHPFSWGLWISIIGMLIVFSLVFYLMNQLGKHKSLGLSSR